MTKQLSKKEIEELKKKFEKPSLLDYMFNFFGTLTAIAIIVAILFGFLALIKFSITYLVN